MMMLWLTVILLVAAESINIETKDGGIITPAMLEHFGYVRKNEYSSTPFQIAPRRPAPPFKDIFAVVDEKFTRISLDDYKGKWLVLFFYPFDFTFVCPTEIVSFSETIEEFRQIKTEVVAVSTDSHHTHLAWIKTPRDQGGLGQMKIPILADISKHMSRDYGVLVTDENDDMFGAALRGLFVIDPQGIVRSIQINDDAVGRSVTETLRIVKAFQFADSHPHQVCPANWKPGDDTITTDHEDKIDFFKTKASIVFEVAPEDEDRANKAFRLYNQAISGSRSEELAVGDYQTALEYFNEFPQAHNNLANILARDRLHDAEAWSHYEQGFQYAVKWKDSTTMASTLNNMGHFTLERAGKNYRQLRKAIAYFDQALEIEPDSIGPLYNKGSAYNAMAQYDMAVEIFAKVLHIDPSHVSANMDMGNIFFLRGDLEKAIFHQDVIVRVAKTAIEKVNALNNKGQFLRDSGLVQEALEAHEEALKLLPANSQTLVNVINSRRQLCRWEKSDDLLQKLFQVVRESLNNGEKACIMPYDATLINRPPEWLTAIAISSSASWKNIDDVSMYLESPISEAEMQKNVQHSGQLRIGYLSYDYRDHPMGHLTLGAIDHHDRTKFDIHAYSYGPNDGSEWRLRAEKDCNKFVDVQSYSDVEAAVAIRQNEVHILIDLMAHTRGTRVGIAAHHPSPIVINYLGYPGTMGSTFTDYIITDRYVSPAAEAVAKNIYTERVVYLPHAYQVNEYDVHLPIKTWANNSTDPLVFCDFNTINKMEPRAFDVWMSILRRVPNSILWLLKPSPPLDRIIEETFLAEASARGVHPDRIVFAERMSKRDHLRRLLQADIFLDTFIYNAHSTAADAFWMHLPIVTVSGSSFASRVASSLLKNVGLDELITHSIKEYEDVAVKLARSKALREKVHAHLAFGAMVFPLFQTHLTTSNLEKAYQATWELSTMATRYHILINAEQVDNFYSKISVSMQKRIDKVLELHHRGQLEDAELGYKRILQVAPWNYDALHLLGMIKYTQLKHQEAVTLLEQAVELLPSAAFFQSNLATVYEALGRHEDAVLASQRVWELEPTSIQGYIQLAALFERLGRYNDITNLFEASFEVLPHLADDDQLLQIYLQYSKALADADRLSDTVNFLESTVLVRFPDSFRARYNFAAALQKNGQADRSNDEFFIAVRQENEMEFRSRGRLFQKHPRPNDRRTIVIYCHEYGQTWWPQWGPSSLGKGVGGSEEAVIFLSRELVALGYWVEVYGNPPELTERIVDGVVWYPYYAFDVSESVDMFVAWRYHISAALCQHAKTCFVWMHDMPVAAAFTKRFAVNINGIFCPSKFHLSQFPQHIQPKGIISPNALDPKYFFDGPNFNNRFVYGSSPSRGLRLLLEQWSRIRACIPDAVLTVYYGFTPAFEKFGKASIPNYPQWRAEMDQLLQQDGIDFVGLVDHETLAVGYSNSGFYLYPTTFPETSCVSLMKAQAMGAIPVTSRLEHSALAESSGKFDLGPRPMGLNDPEWIELWIDAICQVSKRDLDQYRIEMKTWARKTFTWSKTARIWHEALGLTDLQHRSSFKDE